MTSDSSSVGEVRHAAVPSTKLEVTGDVHTEGVSFDVLYDFDELIPLAPQQLSGPPFVLGPELTVWRSRSIDPAVRSGAVSFDVPLLIIPKVHRRAFILVAPESEELDSFGPAAQESWYQPSQRESLSPDYWTHKWASMFYSFSEWLACGREWQSIEAERLGIPPVYVSCREGVKEKFGRLCATWRAERGVTSSVNEMAMHPAYQEIIGMGPAVVPALLKELERRLDHWFWALKAITGQDPVPPSSRGKLKDMAGAWVQWGREAGFRW